MKKMTKKEFNAFPQYIIEIDWMTHYYIDSNKQPLEYIPVYGEANVFEAIKIAEGTANVSDNNSIYCMTLMEKTSEIVYRDGEAYVVYNDAMRCRDIYDEFGKPATHRAWRLVQERNGERRWRHEVRKSFRGDCLVSTREEI